jgi:2-oxoglutarate ferredoxin oxidoreductase subunit beta
MATGYKRPESLQKKTTGFCPGCLHGLANKLIAELIDEFGLREKTIGVLPIGCGTLSMLNFNFDLVVATHGRAPAVATGVKRSVPDRFVFTYQGDGDLAAIGLSEIMHCANRGENVTTVFINNSIYGMTGGQLAPTTLVGQKSTTTAQGRNPKDVGYPMKMCELISQLEAPRYVARRALDSVANIVQAKQALKKAFQIQLDGKGFSFVELLSNCPTNWGLSQRESLEWMRANTMQYFPLGEFKKCEEA